MDGETDVSNAGTITQNYANCQKKKKRKEKLSFFIPFRVAIFWKSGLKPMMQLRIKVVSPD